MLVAPASHPDLATHFTHLTHRVPSMPIPNTMSTMSSDLSSRGSLHKPGYHSRRLQRHDSAVSTSSTRGPLIDLDLSINNRRARSPRRGTQDIRAAPKLADPPPAMLPIYEPRPVLHREDAFRVIEAPARGGGERGYESDELELCTSQFPEFGEECMYDYWT